MDPIILKTAKAVREEVQAWTVRLNDYWAIDPENLRGACGIGSYLLQQALYRVGVESTFIMGRYYSNGYSHRRQLEAWQRDQEDHPNHCWLVVKGKIVDITATQFGESDLVYVTSKADDRYHPLVKQEAAIAELLNSWDDQSPTRYSSTMPTILDQALQKVSL